MKETGLWDGKAVLSKWQGQEVLEQQGEEAEEMAHIGSTKISSWQNPEDSHEEGAEGLKEDEGLDAQAFSLFCQPVPARPNRELFCSALFSVSDFFVSEAKVKDRTSVLRVALNFAKSMFVHEGTLFKKLPGQRPVEVIETAERFRRVMLELHHSMGHRQFQSVWSHFRFRYFVASAEKAIQNFLARCTTCQQFARPNPLLVPGFIPEAKDVLSH